MENESARPPIPTINAAGQMNEQHDGRATKSADSAPAAPQPPMLSIVPHLRPRPDHVGVDDLVVLARDYFALSAWIRTFLQATFDPENQPSQFGTQLSSTELKGDSNGMVAMPDRPASDTGHDVAQPGQLLSTRSTVPQIEGATPRTDALLNRLGAVKGAANELPPLMPQQRVTFIDFARQLERELATERQVSQDLADRTFRSARSQMPPEANELAAMAGDARRLDFIERHKTYPWWNHTRWMMNIGEGANITSRGEGATVRECIDATMAADGAGSERPESAEKQP